MDQTDISIFDIAGPIMVGPSSSHTAGACKIGQFARAFFNGTPTEAIFYLHGSFGAVYKGHATDRALLAGIMKFRTSDSRIKDSFKIATKQGIKYSFIKKDLGKEYHPNTVKIVLRNSRRKISMIGSSVGGGVIEIIKLNDFNIHLRGRAGKYLSLIVMHKKGEDVEAVLKKKINKLDGIRVGNIQRDHFDGKTLSVFNLMGKRRIKLQEVMDLEKNTENVDFVRSLSKLEKQ